jgi:hypothetical protein
MKPGKFDLPIIWRGCDYPVITFKWKNVDGTPFPISGFTPVVRSVSIDFHPIVADAPNGVITISLTRDKTAGFKLGVEAWDWVWVYYLSTPAITYPPVLAGKVEVKDPVSKPYTFLP